jgi:hypothetical protein
VPRPPNPNQQGKQSQMKGFSLPEESERGCELGRATHKPDLAKLAAAAAAAGTASNLLSPPVLSFQPFFFPVLTFHGFGFFFVFEASTRRCSGRGRWASWSQWAKYWPTILKGPVCCSPV